MTTPKLSDALVRAELIHDQAVLIAAIARVAAEIDDELDGEDAVFVTVMQGALVFAGQLATAINRFAESLEALRNLK